MYLFNLIAYLFIGGMRRPTKMSGEASAPPQPPRGGVPAQSGVSAGSWLKLWYKSCFITASRMAFG